MARPAPGEYDAERITLPASVRFPVELEPPPGFDPALPETWPRVDGRLEWVAGRLLYMPPCGDRHQDTVSDVVATLVTWVRGHREFVVASGEAGMLLGEDARGADAAIWRRADLGPYTGACRGVPPVLAVEVAGRDEREPQLREKARWYLERGVAVVWILLPEERGVVVLTAGGETRLGRGAHLLAHPALPHLAPAVDDLFAQVAAAD